MKAGNGHSPVSPPHSLAMSPYGYSCIGRHAYRHGGRDSRNNNNSTYNNNNNNNNDDGSVARRYGSQTRQTGVFAARACARIYVRARARSIGCERCTRRARAGAPTVGRSSWAGGRVALCNRSVSSSRSRRYFFTCSRIFGVFFFI